MRRERTKQAERPGAADTARARTKGDSPMAEQDPTASWPIEPKVVVLPDEHGRNFADDPDPGNVAFDEHGTPLLQWYDSYPISRSHQPCWVLHYLDPDGNGVEDYPIGGTLDAVDWALEQARKHLRMIAGR
jgi:hypothetical protein